MTAFNIWIFEGETAGYHGQLDIIDCGLFVVFLECSVAVSRSCWSHSEFLIKT